MIMKCVAAISVPRFKFSEPRHNLPRRISRVNGERDFTLKFARAYIAQLKRLHHGTRRTSIDFAREIPVNGFGIADFVAVCWNPRRFRKRAPIDVTEFTKVASPAVRAFELKMSDWRKALIQAHRYRYFADVATVVLPIKKLRIASKYIATFKSINVGLWGFDPKTNHIRMLFTPRPGPPLEPRFKSAAIDLVAKASKALRFL